VRRVGLVLTVAVGLLAGTVATATAHIQVSPPLAAPNDAVKFTVLVPGERAPHRTEEVVLKVPSGVLPYSFGDTPGWRRTMQTAKNGAVETITWKGETAPDGFVEFSFLAATPPKPGTIAWKALQIYDDGKVVRWIGGPGSEEPAPVTEISADAPLRNAGGEGPAEGGPPQSAKLNADPTASSGRRSASDGTDQLGLWLAIAALVLAGAALILALRAPGRPSGRRTSA
jgi:uncharacterized protein YcnI